jgi:hypothetical protein
VLDLLDGELDGPVGRLDRDLLARQLRERERLGALVGDDHLRAPRAGIGRESRAKARREDPHRHLLDVDRVTRRRLLARDRQHEVVTELVPPGGLDLGELSLGVHCVTSPSSLD